MPTIDILAAGYSVGTNVGTMAFCSVILIEGEKRLIFDTGHVGRRTYIETQLAARDLGRDDVDLQVLSHAHWDHIQNIDMFAAPVLLHPIEQHYARDPHVNDWATPRWTSGILDTVALIEAGEGYEVMPGVRVLELPGHSPGAIGLEVETPDGICLVVGDAIHSGKVAQRGRSPLVFFDQEAADASIRRCVQTGHLIYPGHDNPFRIKHGDIHYSEAFQLTLTNVGPETPGLQFIPNPPPVEPWVMPGADEQRARLGIS